LPWGWALERVGFWVAGSGIRAWALEVEESVERFGMAALPRG